MPDNHPLKPVRCISCSKIIAEATITAGKLKIACQHCGVSNTIEAEHKPEGRVKVAYAPGFDSRGRLSEVSIVRTR